MIDRENTAESSAAQAGETGPAPDHTHDHGPGRPWLSCVVPLIVFLVGGALEPSASGGGLVGSLGLGESAYPAIYTARLVATLVALALAWPTLRPWLGRPSWWPPLLGLALVVPWIVLAALQREAGWGGIGRSGFNPFAHFGDDSPAAKVFLAVRLLGLVAIVPIVEELFLRGFLMRFVVRENFWTVPFGLLTPAAAGACAIYAVASHPGEAVAAVGWFAVVSGIAAATRQPIDCILAHAATNLALGIFVLVTGTWWLW
jgi:CAAX prenyl protease-like protein